jgi:hypothetical protein
LSKILTFTSIMGTMKVIMQKLEGVNVLLEQRKDYKSNH